MRTIGESRRASSTSSVPSRSRLPIREPAAASRQCGRSPTNVLTSATRETAWIDWFATRPRAVYWIVAALWATIPLHQLVLYHWLASASGLPPVTLDPQLPNRIANTYLIVLSFFVLRIGARELDPVARLAGETIDPSERRWPRGLIVPFLLAVLLSSTYLAGLIQALGLDRLAAAPVLFIATYIAGFLIGFPETAAFWFAIVGLLAVERVGRRGLPLRFPDDRSLGLRPVGRFILFIFVAYATGFIPVLVTGGANNLPNFLAAIAIFVLGIAVMVFAVWRVHAAMAAERERRVAAAREMYAAAYRAAEHALGDDADVSPDRVVSSASLLTAEALVRGAESIFQWPFDEGMQRIVAVVATGVVTAIVVRLIFFAVGV